jgi:hypothetical protein
MLIESSGDSILDFSLTKHLSRSSFTPGRADEEGEELLPHFSTHMPSDKVVLLPSSLA